MDSKTPVAPPALAFLAFGYLCVVAATVWLWGPWGLLGSGAVTLLLGFFIEGS